MSCGRWCGSLSALPTQKGPALETDPWLGLVVVVVVVTASWVAAHYVRRCRARKAGWLPEELRDATLAFVERTFRTDEHSRIVAWVDRAYRSKDGQITLVELKTRSEVRVYASDIIELSAQRLALSTEPGEPVAPVAFVVVESQGLRTALPAGLMSAAEVKALMQRREDLLTGHLTPLPPSHPGLCRACICRTGCHPASEPVKRLASSRPWVRTTRSSASTQRGPKADRSPIR